MYDVRLTWSHPYQSGIIEEMMDDTMEALDDDELEEEADAEVEKVLFDLTDGKLGQAGAVGADLPVSAGQVPRNLIGVLSTTPTGPERSRRGCQHGSRDAAYAERAA